MCVLNWYTKCNEMYPKPFRSRCFLSREKCNNVATIYPSSCSAAVIWFVCSNNRWLIISCLSGAGSHCNITHGIVYTRVMSGASHSLIGELCWWSRVESPLCRDSDVGHCAKRPEKVALHFSWWWDKEFVIHPIHNTLSQDFLTLFSHDRGGVVVRECYNVWRKFD